MGGDECPDSGALASRPGMKRRGHAQRVAERSSPEGNVEKLLVASVAPFPLRCKAAPGRTGDNRPHHRDDDGETRDHEG